MPYGLAGLIAFGVVVLVLLALWLWLGLARAAARPRPRPPGLYDPDEFGGGHVHPLRRDPDGPA